MKKIIFTFFMVLLLIVSFISCNSKEETLLPGSEIPLEEALEESMILPLSDALFYDAPLVATCKAIEEALLVNDKFNVLSASQKFEVIEVLYGNIEEEFILEYIVFEGKGERPVSKDETLLFIFKGDKREGHNNLLKAYFDTEENRKEITKVLENILLTKGEDMRAKDTAFKGMELYSWKSEDGWCFSLVFGTNWNKSYEKVTEKYNVINGLEQLKIKISLLPKGESIFWFNRLEGEIPGENPSLEMPLEEIITELNDWCKDFDIELFYEN